MLISGGSILRRLASLDEDDFYIQYIEAARDAIGYRWPILLQTGPKDKKSIKRLQAAGMTCHHPNLEIWDKNIFEKICPGKAQRVGWDEWVRLMLEEVDVLGEGNVGPNFVTGVELAKPYGFKDIASAVKSTLEGFDFLMTHGVIPRPSQWCISPGSNLAGHEPPPLDYYPQVDLGWYELWKKHGLPFPTGEGPPGAGWCPYGCWTDKFE